MAKKTKQSFKELNLKRLKSIHINRFIPKLYIMTNNIYEE
jgi:hypothetical protein